MSKRPPASRDTQQIAHDVKEALQEGGLAPERQPDAEVLFTKLRDRVYRHCRSVGASREEAEDLTQQTLEVAFKGLPEFREEARITTWAISIAKNLRRNAKRRMSELLVEDGVFEMTDPSMSSLKQLRYEERCGVVRQATEGLEPIERHAVELRYVNELSQDRITEVLQITQKTGARGLLQTCRRKLARELHRILEEHGHGPSLVQDSSG